LVPFIEQHRELLKCDCVVISDTSQFAPGQPAITYGLRGIAYYELRLQGPNRDLHSGTFGGAVVNPANALTQMLAALRNSDGRVDIPGFYDDVVPLTDRERAEFARLPFDEQQFATQLGVTALAGTAFPSPPGRGQGEGKVERSDTEKAVLHPPQHSEPNYTTLERRWARPTYDINGLTSGYQGEGAKTVLPAQASAKFSFRLVPNQQPEKITAALQAKLQQLCPPGITMELIDFHGAPGVLVPLDSPYIAAAQRAITAGFGTPPVFMREGGSIPVVATFRQLLQVDTLLLGWGQDDDNTHSPNEKFSLNDFLKGIRSSAQLLQEIANL
jgi:succinyl-diaminopimelate desuccinylase